MTHKGKIVENIIRKSGYSLTKLAEKLGISRNTLYKRFQNPNLDYGFILEVGNCIYYDFSNDFPEMKQSTTGLPDWNTFPTNNTSKSAEIWKMENKYANLLEKYNKLLEMLVKISNQNELHNLKNSILKFFEKENVDQK